MRLFQAKRSQFAKASAAAFFLLGLSAPIAAKAQIPDWIVGLDAGAWTLGGYNDTSAWFSRSAIQPAGAPYRRLWTRLENAQAENWGVFSSSGTQLFVRSAIDLVEVDCSELKYRTLQATYYSGESLSGESSSRLSKAPQWSYAVPGTFGEAQVSRACFSQPRVGSRAARRK